MADEAQAKMWKGSGGAAWVEAEALVERLLAPIEAAIVGAVAAARAKTVLDVGCGTGGTTISIARRIGDEGSCTGIDISEPMIGAARARAGREGVTAGFLLGDAETHDFAPATYDMIVSRFGVMFFDDPVRAFANLRGAAAAGAVLNMVVWRSPQENDFMTAAERAAAPLLDLPTRRPDEPGQFGFADARRVRRILSDSGWEGVEIRPADFECAMPATALAAYVGRFGLVGRALDGADEATRESIVAAVIPAFERFVHGDEVRFTAACWTIQARAPAGA